VLSDPQKREIYDRFGEDGLKAGIENADQAVPPGARFNGFPPGTSFSFSSGGGGGQNFSGVDAQRLFEAMFASGSFSGTGTGAFPFSSFGDNGGSSFGADPMDIDSNIFGNSSTDGFEGFTRKRSAPQVAEVEYPLNVTLEELYGGARKKMKITRKTQDKSSGVITNEHKTLELVVHRGWKAGTKLRYEGAGDQLIGRPRQDVVFVLTEKPHSLFSRDGSDLHCKVRIPLKQALLGGLATRIRLLDGTMLDVTLSGVHGSGSRVKFEGKGMYDRKKNANGDLIVQIDVEFPALLSREQQLAVEQAF